MPFVRSVYIKGTEKPMVISGSIEAVVAYITIIKPYIDTNRGYAGNAGIHSAPEPIQWPFRRPNF